MAVNTDAIYEDLKHTLGYKMERNRVKIQKTFNGIYSESPLNVYMETISKCLATWSKRMHVIYYTYCFLLAFLSHLLLHNTYLCILRF